jgi:hypothetical protein
MLVKSGPIYFLYLTKWSAALCLHMLRHHILYTYTYPANCSVPDMQRYFLSINLSGEMQEKVKFKIIRASNLDSGFQNNLSIYIKESRTILNLDQNLDFCITRRRDFPNLLNKKHAMIQQIIKNAIIPTPTFWSCTFF